MFDRQIVITGVGIVSALGHVPQTVWNGLCNGSSAVAPIDSFSTEPFCGVSAAPVRQFDPPVARKHKQPWTSSNAVQFAMAATRDALGAADLLDHAELRSRMGVAFGSTLACMELMVQLDQDAIVNGARTVDPMLFPDIGASAPSCRVSQQFGLQGFNSILANGQTASLDAIHYGALLVDEGLVPIVLVGGVEELTRASFLYHAHTSQLSANTQDGTESTALQTGGIQLGEGSAVLVLETLDHALSRGATILAEFVGYGTSFCPEGSRSPQATDCAASAMRFAISAAGLEPADIDLIFSSANGDGAADAIEAAAVGHVVPGIPAIAIKRTLGELNSTTGAMQAVLGAAVVHESGAAGSSYLLPDILGRKHTSAIQDNPSLPTVCLINTFSSSDSASSFSSMILRAPACGWNKTLAV